jgi:hypothetical protein
MSKAEIEAIIGTPDEMEEVGTKSGRSRYAYWYGDVTIFIAFSYDNSVKAHFVYPAPKMAERIRSWLGF